MKHSISTYALIKDGEVVGKYDTTYSEEKFLQSVAEEYDTCILVSCENEIHIGDMIEEFEDADICKPKLSLYERYQKGLLRGLSPDVKVQEDGTLIAKTEAELAQAGLLTLSIDQRINEDTGEIERKTWTELISDNDITYEYWLDEVVRPVRDSLLNKTDLAYCNPEKWSSYSEEEKQAWSNYKQLLRDFPETEPAVCERDEIQWPSKPGE
jgi:hypothetical protein